MLVQLIYFISFCLIIYNIFFKQNDTIIYPPITTTIIPLPTTTPLVAITTTPIT